MDLSYLVDAFVLLSSEKKETLKLWYRDGMENKLGTVEDDELGEPVIWFTGNHGHRDCLVYPTEPKRDLKFRYMHLFSKMQEKTFTMEIIVEDIDEKRLVLRFGTNYPNVSAYPDVCYIPMSLQKHWSHCSIDLKQLVESAFRTEYARVCMIRLGTNIKLRALFMNQSPKVSLYMTSSHYASRFNQKRGKSSATKRIDSLTKQSTGKYKMKTAGALNYPSKNNLNKTQFFKKESQSKHSAEKKRKIDKTNIKNKDSKGKTDLTVSEHSLERKYSGTLSDSKVKTDGQTTELMDEEAKENRQTEKKRLVSAGSTDNTAETDAGRLIEVLEEDTHVTEGLTGKETYKESTLKSSASLLLRRLIDPSKNLLDGKMNIKSNTLLTNKKNVLSGEIKISQVKTPSSSTIKKSESLTVKKSESSTVKKSQSSTVKKSVSSKIKKSAINKQQAIKKTKSVEVKREVSATRNKKQTKEISVSRNTASKKQMKEVSATRNIANQTHMREVSATRNTATKTQMREASASRNTANQTHMREVSTPRNTANQTQMREVSATRNTANQTHMREVSTPRNTSNQTHLREVSTPRNTANQTHMREVSTPRNTANQTHMREVSTLRNTANQTQMREVSGTRNIANQTQMRELSASRNIANQTQMREVSATRNIANQHMREVSVSRNIAIQTQIKEVTASRNIANQTQMREVSATVNTSTKTPLREISATRNIANKKQKGLRDKRKQLPSEGGTANVNRTLEPSISSKSQRKVPDMPIMSTEKSAKALAKYDYI